MLNILVTAIWLYLQIGFANGLAVSARKWPVLKNWNYPLDFGFKWKGEPLLGKNKTLRGFVVGTVTGAIVSLLEFTAYQTMSESLRSNILIDYTTINPIILGLLLGAGALLGDAVKSFFKRRQNIQPGGPWVPFDQIDYTVGASLLSLIYLQLPIFVYVLIVLIGAGLTAITNVFAYLVGIKEQPW